jgi:hypothetical protein
MKSCSGQAKKACGPLQTLKRSAKDNNPWFAAPPTSAKDTISDRSRMGRCSQTAGEAEDQTQSGLMVLGRQLGLREHDARLRAN